MPGQRIAVLGAGANGASIGADLTQAGLDVTLIEQWPEHVEAMRADGVRIVMPQETQQVPVQVLHLCELAAHRPVFDVVFMLVKAYDSRWAARLIEPYLSPDGLLIGAQNGMTVDTVSKVVGAHRTMGCVIEITSMMFDPGIVERHSPPSRSWFAVGGIHGGVAGREEEAAALLRHSGSVEIVTDIQAAKWMKLVSNATTLVTTAILGLPMVGAAAIPQMRDLMLRSGQEALDAAVSLGHPVIPIFGLSASDVAKPDSVVETLLDTLLRGFVMPNSKTTILQDWMKGRRSEAEDLNGLVAAVHAAAGRRAPVNKAVVELARRIERGEVTPGPQNLAALLELSRA